MFMNLLWLSFKYYYHKKMRKLKSIDPKETHFTNKVFGTIQTLVILVSSFALHLSNLQVTEKILITHKTYPAFITVT